LPRDLLPPDHLTGLIGRHRDETHERFDRFIQ